MWKDPTGLCGSCLPFWASVRPLSCGREDIRRTVRCVFRLVNRAPRGLALSLTRIYGGVFFLPEVQGAVQRLGTMLSCALKMLFSGTYPRTEEVG